MKTAMLVTYVLFAIGVLVGIIIHSPGTVFLCKPMLMLMLMFYLFWSLYKNWLNEDSMMMIALLGAWVGDIGLLLSEMFTNDPNNQGWNIFDPNENWAKASFFTGMAGFLMMQLTYQYVFHSTGDPEKVGLLQQKRWLVFPFFLLASGIFSWIIVSPIGAVFFSHWVLTIPVLLYCMSVSWMILAAINRWGRVSSQSFNLTMIGAVMFLISDFLISFNKFILPFPMSELYVMLLYMPAQFLIIEGFVRQGKFAVP
jgi:uncharacterized membrane protein YhhN